MLQVHIAIVKDCMSNAVCCAQPRLADLLLAPAVDSDGIVTLAVHDFLAVAGLQSDATWCVVVKQARLVCLYLWVLRPLHTAVLLQGSTASVLGAQKQTAAAD